MGKKLVARLGVHDRDKCPRFNQTYLVYISFHLDCPNSVIEIISEAAYAA